MVTFTFKTSTAVLVSGAVGSARRKQPEQQLENASARSGDMQMAVGGAYLSFFRCWIVAKKLGKWWRNLGMTAEP